MLPSLSSLCSVFWYYGYINKTGTVAVSIDMLVWKAGRSHGVLLVDTELQRTSDYLEREN